MALTVLVSPVPAQAGLFSSILGDRAYADTPLVGSTSAQDNSQTIALLQANVLPLTIPTSSSVQDGSVDNNSDVGIADNALIPSTSPLGVPAQDTDFGDPSSDQISVYVVRKGDAISQIADMFGVSVNTILWANDMKKGDTIKEGDVLFILPISGIEHTVTKGQTLQGIAKLYSADINDVLQYNSLSLGTQLAVGDKLIIPNAQKSAESDKPVKNLSASVAKDQQYYATHPTKNLSGYFINPVPGYRLSQGIHDNNGVDLAIGTGTPIHASASGTVLLARNGYNGGFGNFVIINHPNGTQTLYAHQSKIATSTGAQVTQGQVIGYVGSTGRSTGPHLHFEVHGARNPGADNSWAR